MTKMPGKPSRSRLLSLLFSSSRAKCFHCSRDLCLTHLTEHTQIVERQTRVSANEELLNTLEAKLRSLSIPSRISETPKIQLEKWRVEAHRKLDQLAEQKRQELQTKIDDYRTMLAKRTREHRQMIDWIRRQPDRSQGDEQIEQIKQFLRSVDQHSIQISSYDFFVNIRVQLLENVQQTRQPVKKRSLSVCLL